MNAWSVRNKRKHKRLAIERFAEAATAEKMLGTSPVLHLPDAENRMLRVLARIQLGESDSALLLWEANELRVVTHGLS